MTELDVSNLVAFMRLIFTKLNNLVSKHGASEQIKGDIKIELKRHPCGATRFLHQ